LSFAGKFGKLLGRWIPFLSIGMSIFDTVMGFIEGFKKDGIIGGIKGAFNGFIDGLVGTLVDMLAGALSWFLELIGMDKLAASVGNVATQIMEGIKGLFGSWIDMIIGLVTGDGDKFMTSLGNIWKSVINIFTAPLELMYAFIQDIFDFAGIDLPDFDISEFFSGVVDDVVNAVKNFFGIGDSPEELAVKEEKRINKEAKKKLKESDKAFKAAETIDSGFGSVTTNGVEEDQAGRDERAALYYNRAAKADQELIALQNELAALKEKTANDQATFGKMGGILGDDSAVLAEQQEFELTSGSKAEMNAARIANENQATKEQPIAPAGDTNNNIVSNTNNQMQAPADMRVGNDDLSMAAMVGA
jgi:hypothetical protein